MFDFIYLLRILAAALITNSHYVGVYPSDIIANGGLLGNVLFFAISGYCLFPVKRKFLNWYGKRIIRIYPSVWIITIAYLLIGLYEAGSFRGLIRLMFFPTFYHFVASIVLLYIVFFFVAKLLQKYPGREDTMIAILAIAAAVAYALVYILAYDRSFYHIDNVHEPMIRFLFFFSMLAGVYFKIHEKDFVGKNKALSWILTAVLFAAYFASKIAFSRGYLSSGMQWANQVLVFALMFCIFRAFVGLENKLGKMSERLHRAMVFVASITFEIYLVQQAIIPKLNIGPFPVNFLIVSASIFVLAFALNRIRDFVVNGVKKLSKRKTTA